MKSGVPRQLRDIVIPILGKHEGRRTHPYDDSTGRTPVLQSNGKISIGIGRNLTDRGLSEAEIDYLFNNDLDIAYAEGRRAIGYDNFDALTANRQAVIMMMAFNMGIDRLLRFREMLLAVKDGRYNDAASEMLDSRWARQVRSRADELAKMMLQG